MKLHEIASRLEVELEGNGEIEIVGPAGIENAGSDQITFISNPKYSGHLKTTTAGAVILAEDAPPCPIPNLRSSNPYLTFARIVQLFYAPPRPVPGIHPTASVCQSATIGEDCSIGANVVISEEVHLGENSILYPGVVIYPFARIGEQFIAHSQSVVREHCQIGDRVILQNGAIVGADGFGFAPLGDGRFEKIVQSGIAVLEDDVELGAYSCVDRATVGETRVGKGTKIDNLVQIGHGSTVGKDTILAAQVGLAGSTHVGDRVILAGQVGVAGHLSIGDEARAIAQTGVARDVEAGKTVAGYPEMEARAWKRNYLILKNLPKLVRSLRKLEARVAELEAAADGDASETN